jgi:hypothetical protein
MAERLKKWTKDKIEEVMLFKQSHSNAETLQQFHISAAQLHGWRHDMLNNVEYGTTQREYGRKARQPRVKLAVGAPAARTNGASMKDVAAIASLEAWQLARFPGPAPTPAEVHILNALAILRGSK